jgi:hypothetical protein
LVGGRGEVREVGADGLDEKCEGVRCDAALLTLELVGHEFVERPPLLQRLAVDRGRCGLLQILERRLTAPAPTMMGHDGVVVRHAEQGGDRVTESVGLCHHQDAARPEEVLAAGLGEAQADVRCRAADLLDYRDQGRSSATAGRCPRSRAPTGRGRTR